MIQGPDTWSNGQPAYRLMMWIDIDDDGYCYPCLEMASRDDDGYLEVDYGRYGSDQIQSHPGSPLPDLFLLVRHALVTTMMARKFPNPVSAEQEPLF